MHLNLNNHPFSFFILQHLFHFQKVRIVLFCHFYCKSKLSNLFFLLLFDVDLLHFSFCFLCLLLNWFALYSFFLYFIYICAFSHYFARHFLILPDWRLWSVQVFYNVGLIFFCKRAFGIPINLLNWIQIHFVFSTSLITIFRLPLE